MLAIRFIVIYTFPQREFVGEHSASLDNAQNDYNDAAPSSKPD
jgi:hypothetical protein